ncbi:hypothetical protein GQ54DRAFT_208007 [Martensiomyces pterosporus]|nr:hypothetical protein GQ54DRAFT_208007 [Martensiomyces pterosporus]
MAQRNPLSAISLFAPFPAAGFVSFPLCSFLVYLAFCALRQPNKILLPLSSLLLRSTARSLPLYSLASCPSTYAHLLILLHAQAHTQQQQHTSTAHLASTQLQGSLSTNTCRHKSIIKQFCLQALSTDTKHQQQPYPRFLLWQLSLNHSFVS